MNTSRLADIFRPALEAMVPRSAIQRAHRTELALDEDGRISDYAMQRAIETAIQAWQPRVFSAEDNADHTNTDTANRADAVSMSIVLPDGTWTLYGVGGGVSYHSATASHLLGVSLDGTDGSGASVSSVPAGDRVSVTAVSSKAGVIGGGSVTCKIGFRSSTAGTMTMDSSWIQVIAIRTA